MRIYLSSDARDDLFVGATEEAVKRIKETFGEDTISFFFPPKAIGGDLGRIDLNVARDSSFEKRNLTPLLNLESVQSFERAEAAREKLVEALVDLLRSRIKERISYTYVPRGVEAPEYRTFVQP